MASQTYNAGNIQVLEGLEAVRMRPGMYIGTTSARGLHHLLWEIVDNAIDEAANGFAAEINEEGGFAKAYACDVLDKDVCYAVADQVLSDLGPCDILLNGAGGNNPRATTDKEYFEVGALSTMELTISREGAGYAIEGSIFMPGQPEQVFSKRSPS